MNKNHKLSLSKEFGIIFILSLISFSGMQSIYGNKLLGWSRRAYLLFHLIALVLALFLIFKSFKNKGVLYKMAFKFLQLPVSNVLKFTVIVIFMGNLISIGIGEPCYPFYDVGMFRYTTKFSNPTKIVYRTKYYYWEDGKAKILDLRKEGFTLLSDHLGWGYTHEFTFSANYHNKGQKENFDFISAKVKPLGIDTLWVGVQTLNYDTGIVSFDTDICKAIEINTTKNIYYGPIYIPQYQLNKCK